MKVGNFKEICGLISACGLIDEFHIDANNHFIGYDAGKTFVADLEYDNDLPAGTSIINVKGMIQTFNLFADDVEVVLANGRLNIDDGDTVASIVLSASEPLKITIPSLTDEDYEIIVNNVDYKRLNSISRLRPEAIINEYYFLFVADSKLMIHIGEDSGSYVGKRIAEIAPGDKADSSKVAKYTMNVSECLKNIRTNATIKIISDKIMSVYSKTETYKVAYHLAPRVD